MKRHVLILSIITILSGCGTIPDSPAEKYQHLSAKQLIHQGEVNLGKGYYDEANERFEALKALYPFSPHARQAQLDLIYSYYKLGHYAEGVAAADRYVRLYPRGKDVDYAYYMKGLISFEDTQTTIQRWLAVDVAQLDLSSMKQAYISFNKLVTMYPKSPYAWDARLRMIYIRNLMARHEVQVAQFYLDNQMYIAAVNRAANVVIHYQGTPQVKKALQIMAQGYQYLKLPQLAKDTRKVIANNYHHA